mmetsp:Transcript_20739/g.52662  ORF Transcript_20739/g.52662 Transcript_20739/m.52662 type:complete len:231 (+) Transcript_20739:326-1018(+)
MAASRLLALVSQQVSLWQRWHLWWWCGRVQATCCPSMQAQSPCYSRYLMFWGPCQQLPQQGRQERQPGRRQSASWRQLPRLATFTLKARASLTLLRGGPVTPPEPRDTLVSHPVRLLSPSWPPFWSRPGSNPAPPAPPPCPRACTTSLAAAGDQHLLVLAWHPTRPSCTPSCRRCCSRGAWVLLGLGTATRAARLARLLHSGLPHGLPLQPPGLLPVVPRGGPVPVLAAC